MAIYWRKRTAATQIHGNLFGENMRITSEQPIGFRATLFFRRSLFVLGINDLGMQLGLILWVKLQK